jgi:toxin secretion/phage lysis holin
MNVSAAKITITGAIGAIGAALANLLGGWSNDLITLLIFMAADLITGLIVAGVFHASKKTEGGAIESNTMFKGLVKKIVMLIFVALCARIDITLGINFVRTAVVIGFIANEFISIIENAGLMGIPLPAVVTKALELLKAKTDEKSDT